MAEKLLYQRFAERANELRRSAEELKQKSQSRHSQLPELALAAQEERDGGRKAFEEAIDEVDRLAAEALQAELAATALDERSAEVRREDMVAEKVLRAREMSDARAAYDKAAQKMDAVLRNSETAYCAMREATRDLADALRLAGFPEGSQALSRRASRMLHAASWDNAPTLTQALGLEGKFRHQAKSLESAANFLPQSENKETVQ